MTMPSASALAARVASVIGETLGLPAADVASSPSLPSLPGFDSLTVVNVLERLEDDLGIEVAPELIVPEAFESVESVAGLFTRSNQPPSSEAGPDRRIR
jgi:acyl carrier protein